MDMFSFFTFKGGFYKWIHKCIVVRRCQCNVIWSREYEALFDPRIRTSILCSKLSLFDPKDQHTLMMAVCNYINIYTECYEVFSIEALHT